MEKVNVNITPATSCSKRKIAISHQDDEFSTDSEFKAETEAKIARTETVSDVKLDSDGEEISLEESLFSNDLLLREIFKHLNFKDLKSCRLVQRLWNLEATKLLLKNFPMEPIRVGCHKVTFQQNRFCVDRSVFEDLIKKSQIFPCNAFEIRIYFLKKDTTDFFTEFGHLVKSFHFQNEPKFKQYCNRNLETPGKELIMFLSQNLPNLETLNLNCTMRITDTEVESLLNTIQFKKLHTLELTKNLLPSFVSTIMKTAPNLTKIYLRCQKRFSRSLSQLVQMKAIPLLKNIPLNFDKSMLDLFERVLEQEPKLEVIETIQFRHDEDSPLDLVRIGRILTTIFHQSSESLKEIYMILPLGYLPSLKIPVLPNVTSLCIYYFESDHQTPNVAVPVFPPEVDFQQTFPNLKKMELCFGDFEELRSKEIFPKSSTPLLSVRSLKVYSCGSDHLQIPEIWMKQFCTLFPNITEAYFCEMSFPSVELVWSLHFVENLRLTIAAGENLNLFPQWDSAFTGFPHETVRRFHKKSCSSLEMFEESDVKDLRVKPSLVDLKKLKQFCMEFLYDGMDFNDRDDKDDVTAFGSGVDEPVLMVKDQIVMSHLTKRFGFEMCRELKSNISIRLTEYDTLTMRPLQH